MTQPAPTDWATAIGMSPVVRRGPLVMVSGTAPVDDAGEVVAKGDAEAQARRCLARVCERLESVGASRSSVIRTRVMLAAETDWEAVARVHGEVFGDVRPACTMIRCELLDPDYLLEVDVTAWAEE